MEMIEMKAPSRVVLGMQSTCSHYKTIREQLGSDVMKHIEVPLQNQLIIGEVAQSFINTNNVLSLSNMGLPRSQHETSTVGPLWNQFTPRTMTGFFPKKLLGQALEEAWPRVKSALEINGGISCQLNLNEGYMKISTTRNYDTSFNDDDRVSFHTATQLIKLLSRGAPVDKALKVLNVGSNGMRLRFMRLFDLAKSRKVSTEKYWQRSKQLSESTLGELEKLAGCGVLMHIRHDGVIAYTATVQGSKLVDKIVGDCIVHGVHPLSQIKKIRRTRKADKQERKLVVDDLGRLSI